MKSVNSTSSTLIARSQGFCEAQVVAQGVRENSSADENIAPQHWIRAIVAHSRTEETKVQEGTCGSVVWNEDGDAVGFYRFAQSPNRAHVVSVEPLIEFGFTVTSIP